MLELFKWYKYLVFCSVYDILTYLKTVLLLLATLYMFGERIVLLFNRYRQTATLFRFSLL